MRLSISQYAVMFNHMDILEFIKKNMPSAFFIVGQLQLPAIVIAAQRNRHNIVLFIDECTRCFIPSVMQPTAKDSSMVVYRGHYSLIEKILGRKDADVQPTLNYYLDSHVDLSDNLIVDPGIFRQLDILGASLKKYFEDRIGLDRYRKQYIMEYIDTRREHCLELDRKTSFWCYQYIPVPDVPFLYGLDSS